MLANGSLGWVHNLAGTVTFLSMILICLVLARRFPGARRWTGRTCGIALATGLVWCYGGGTAGALTLFLGVVSPGVGSLSPPPASPVPDPRSREETAMEKGPQSYFPSIEKKYGKPISYWTALIDANTELTRHGQLVTWLKQEHGLGHGHANALVAHVLANRS